MSVDWTQIILALIGILGAVVSSVLIPYLKSRTTEKQREDIEFWVGVAVTAAEKKYDLEGQGAKKKADVIKFIREKGFKISDEQLDQLINFTVEKLVNKPWNQFVGRENQTGIIMTTETIDCEKEPQVQIQPHEEYADFHPEK